MKSILLRAALCAAVSFSVAAQWNTAQGETIHGAQPGKSVPPRRIQRKPAPKPLAQPKALVNRHAPTLPQKTPTLPQKIAQNALKVAPRIAAGRRPVSIQNLDSVAHLRRHLVSHRWSYVFAAKLKHAPKTICFHHNGTVKTELAGEIWYWEALDGWSVSLRTLLCPSQPGITLEFNEDYTSFQYILPDQTVAVYGAELDAIAQGPALANSTDSEPTTLEQALLSYLWSWNDVAGDSDKCVRFDMDKTLQVAGRTYFWNATGPRTVHVELDNGVQTDLLFDTTFSIFTDGNAIGGSRETEAPNSAGSEINQ